MLPPGKSIAKWADAVPTIQLPAIKTATSTTIVFLLPLIFIFCL
ncbi:MAG: hypothetical protein ACNYVW_00840 [Methanosarcinales archaeon]